MGRWWFGGVGDISPWRVRVSAAGGLVVLVVLLPGGKNIGGGCYWRWWCYFSLASSHITLLRIRPSVLCHVHRFESLNSD